MEKKNEEKKERRKRRKKYAPAVESKKHYNLLYNLPMPKKAKSYE